MPVLTDIRLAEQRFITAAFISEQPTTIKLLPSRGTAIQTVSGGHDYGPPTARPAQTFRVSARSQGAGEQHSPTDGGKSVEFEYDLIGTYDSVVEIGDTWDETAPDGSSIHYHVDVLKPSNGYEVCAVVSAYATQPQHGDA